MMRRWLLIAALAASPAAAQDIDDDDGGRGFLTSRIEGLLSGAGREVRIEGFAGALSSRATLDRLTIADDEGVWLTIEDAAFDWNRSALFDRRLVIEELTAGAIVLERIPEGDPDAIEPPRATAREFSLPELPVSIDIERVAADRVTLGEPILGERSVLAVEGSARLSEGTADARVEATRLDAAEGRFVVAASFDPEAGGLDLDLALAEGEGGLAATLLGLPGEPSVELTATATGVPEDLSAEFALATAGSPRLSGTFGLEGAAGARAFALDASGDISPLLAAQYGEFFGDALDVVVEGAQVEGGGFDLAALSVSAAELSLEGSASIAADGLPDAFDLRLRIDDGGEVLLPGGVRIASADLAAQFDAAEGERWTLQGGVESLAVDAATVALLGLDGGGTISRDGEGSVTGQASVVARGVALTDPGLARAVGDQALVRLDAAWDRGAPVRLQSLEVAAGDELSVGAQGTIDGLLFDGEATAAITDLARLSGLAGRDLGGALDARFEGSVQPLSGAFDGVLTGTGRDLATGIEAADALIGGEADLRVDAARTVEGTTIREARIATEALEATVEGTLTPGGEVPVDVTYEASLDDVGRVLGGVSGPVSLEGSARRDAVAWTVALDASAPEQGTITLEAQVPDEGDAEVDFDASVADLGAYVPQLPGPAEIEGEATRTGGDWTARLTADLPQEIGADVSATYPAEGRAVANVDARIADLGAFVEQLPGEATFTGRVTREDDGAIGAIFMTELPLGIGAEVNAQVPVDGPATADFDARVEELGAFVEQLPGRATLSGTASRDQDGRVTADVDLDAPEGITAAVEATVPTEGPITAEFDAQVAEVGAFTEALEGPATLAGTATREGETTRVSARVDAPEGIAATADVRLVGERIEADFDANLADVGAFTGALEGPASVIGTAVREDGETTVSLDAAGPEGIEATIRATLPAEGPIEVTYRATAADVSALAPLPEGPATLAGTATRQTSGDLSTQARLDAPAGIGFDLTASLAASGDLEARLDGAVAEPALIREGLPGPIQAVVVARRVDGTITADADVSAPGGTEARLDVSLPPEGEADVDFDLTLAEPELYLNGLPGPVRATGTARRDAQGWMADVDASAGDGSRVVADARLPDEGRATIDFDASVAQLGRFVPQLQGEATARGQAAREDGVWSATAAVTAPAGIEGDLSGSLEPSGDVDATFDLGIGQLGAFVPQLPGAARASGTVSRTDGAFAADVDATGPAGTQASVQGTFDPEGAVDVTFDARLGDVSVLVDRLSGPISAQGTARSDGGPIALDVAVQGPGSSSTQLTGSLARDASTADIRAVGSVPLEIANPFLRPRALAGLARFDLTLNGPPELSSLSGTVTAADARLALPDQRVSLEGIDATLTLSGPQADVDVSAALSSGGTLRISGPIALAPPFEAGLAVALNGLVIRDPLLYQTAISGELSIDGPLRGTAGRISGTLDLAETEVRIPSSGLGGSGAIPFVEHEGASEAVLVTRRRARIADEDPITRRGTPQRNSFNLDLLIRAPNQIFIRGRGLDAELGGRLRLTGTTANIVPLGQFDLIRGRLDLLGKRFTFDDGSISLQGDFVPIVRLVAVTDVDGDQLAIILEGELTEPELRIESAAGLPQDEAIARLLFGRDLRQLSPLQAARLASAVAELSGRTGTSSILGGLREGVGLDDLDITSSDDGTLALRAGAYISDNIYTDLSIDEDGQTEINLNLDVTRNITVQGRASATGETGLGVFFERDY